MAEPAKSQKESGHTAGKMQRNSVPQGSYGVDLYPPLVPKWSTNQADVNDTVTMEVTCTGIKDGMSATLTVFEKNGNCADVMVGESPIPAQVSGNKISKQWKYPNGRKLVGASSKWPSLSRFFFQCDCAGESKRSGLLQLSGTISISLFDTDNKAVSNEPAVIKTSYSQLLDATTDGSGTISLKKIPLGFHQIKFPKNPLIDLKISQAVTTIHEFAPLFPLSFFEPNKFYADSFYLACSHEVKESKYKRTVKRPTFFEVVPSWEENGADKVFIIADPRKEVKDSNGKPLESVDKEGGLAKSVFECAYSPGDGKANFFEKTFWRSFTKPNEYKISVGSQHVTLRAYCPDKYGFKLSLPEIKKLSVGRKLKKEVSNITEGGQQNPSSPPKEYKAPKPKVDGWNPFTTFPYPWEKDVPLEVSRNGKALEISSLKYLGGVIKTIGEFENIIEQIKKDVPKAGIYFDLELKVLQGTFETAFCWKEYKNHQAFLSIAAKLEIEIFSVGLEIGVGVSGYGIACQIYGKVEGKLTVSYNGERISPEGDKSLKITYSTTIEGSLGIRVQVIFMASATGAIKTAIEIENGSLTISSEEGVSVSCGLRWTGLKGSISISLSAGKKGGDKDDKDEDEEDEDEDLQMPKQDQEERKALNGTWESEWVEGKDLGTFQFPSAEEYTPPIIQREDVKRIIEKVFDKEGKINVLISFGRFFDVIEDLEAAINDHEKIRRTGRNIQALAYEIHHALWGISNKYAGHKKDRLMELKVYNDFRELGGLEEILKRNCDMANDLSKEVSSSEKE
jgi:hypothetical protein